MNAPPQDETQSSSLSTSTRVIAVVMVLGAVLAAILFALSRSRALANETTRRTSESATGPLVRTAAVVSSAPQHHLSLLGEARPFASVTLYAKVSGYLKSIAVDKGDHVNADQVVAVVESPETDASWSAATADHAQKAITASRLKQLLEKKFASQEETDLAAADEAVSRERLKSLAQQREFERLKVPFNGIVTARFADPGALVQNAASSQTSALPVVTVEDTDSLRVYAYLDQSDAATVRVGLPAMLTMDERAGVKMPVKITRTSGELDPRTRKLLVEFDIDNRGPRSIVAGSFVRIELDVPAPVLPEFPAEALIVRQNRSYVAALSPDSTVHLREVTIATNDGRRIRAITGIAAGDRVVLNAGDALADGSHVRPATDSVATGARR